MRTAPIKLPDTLRVFERGWLSSNNILMKDADGAVLIDSGYASHAEQTLALVAQALGSNESLTRLINTHCHTDHIGGNAMLQSRYRCHTTVPVGEAPIVERWRDEELMLSYADQHADRFRVDATLSPGDAMRIGAIDWQVIGAPGHDRHALVFYAPERRLLISGDALWESGFGVIFPALFGDLGAFAETRTTLDTIARLDARTVIPGHGRVFGDVGAVLDRAYFKLESYEQDVLRLVRHAAKVMLSFALMEQQSMPIAALPAYVTTVGFMRDLNERHFKWPPERFADWLVHELVRAGAITAANGMLRPRGTA